MGILDDERDGRLYGLLDAARDADAVRMYLEINNPEHASLFEEGPREPKLGEVAPYLVSLAEHSKARAALFRELATPLPETPGHSLGEITLLLRSPADIGPVRRHLRGHLLVFLPDGRRVFFRFYDPRVFAAYLPTCNAAETLAFFGPIVSFAVRSADGLVTYARDQDGRLLVT